MQSKSIPETPLQQAVVKQDINLVKYFANPGSINRVDSKTKNTALHYAVQSGNLDIIDELLRLPDINIRARNDHLKSPIHLALASEKLEKIEIFEKLLRNLGITLPTDSIKQQQEVIEKFESEYEDEIQSILRCYFLIWNLLQNEKRNPKLAISTDDAVFSEKTLEFALEIIKKTQRLDSYETDILSYYLQYMVPRRDVNALKNPLIQAVLDNQLKYVRIFANKGSVNTVDNAGNTPLHYAVVTGNMEVINELIQYSNINIRFRNKQDKSPIHLAIESGNIEIFERLLSTQGIMLSSCTMKEQKKAIEKFGDDYQIQTVLRCYYALVNLHRHNNPKLTKNSDHTLFSKDTLEFALKIIQARQDVHDHELDLLRYYAEQIKGCLPTADTKIQDKALHADEKYRVWNNLFRIAHNSPFRYKYDWQGRIRTQALDALKNSVGELKNIEEKIATLQEAKKQAVFASHRHSCFFYRLGKTTTVKAIDKMIKAESEALKQSRS